MLFATLSVASTAYGGSAALNVALPAIQVDLDARGADLLWISNSYMIAQASLLVIFASLSDRSGRNNVCMLGILLFGIASGISNTLSRVGQVLTVGVMGDSFSRCLPVRC